MRVVPSAADPEADLARLRRPTGPWLHLLDATPADARQLGWLLGRDGLVVRILRGHCGRSAYGLLDEAGAALQLPGDPVEDWTSLAALLTDMSWLPGAGHVLVVTRASLLLAAEPVAELRGLVEAVREVARGRAEEGDPVPFHLVLQDDAVGLAVLRSRLDAVGARHADLSGWDAEEPAAEAVVGARSAFTAGDGRPDEVDAAVGAAVSEVDGVVELRRAWEEFRGQAGGVVVRVYGPILGDPRRGVHVASVVARAAAAAGSACVVVPLPAAADRDARQAAVAAAATIVWPVPALPPEPTAPADVPVAVEAAPPPVAEPRADQVPADEPRPGHPTPALSSDAPLAPGPDAGDPDHAAMIAELVRWADDRAGVVGVVTAWVDLDGTRTLVVGVALDGRTDPDAVCAEVAPLAPAALVEPFAPSRSLSPAHLRLTRFSTRVWTRRAERAQPRPTKTTRTLDRPSPPDVVSLGPPPTRDTADPRADLDLGGFTLVGIDRDVPIAKGPPTPDERDRALTEWAQKQPTAIALLRGIATVADDEIPVYCLGVTETADPEVARRDLAAAVAATGTSRAAAEAFAPAGAIPAFHLDLTVSSTRLWPAPA